MALADVLDSILAFGKVYEKRADTLRRWGLTGYAEQMERREASAAEQQRQSGLNALAQSIESLGE